MKQPVWVKVLHVLTIVLIVLASLFAFLAQWVMKTWHNLTMDELVSQLSVSIEGTSSEIIISGLLEVLLPTVLIVLIFVIVYHLIRKYQIVFRVGLILGIVASIVTLVITKGIVWDTLAVEEYLEYQRNPSTFIEENYVDPDSVEITFPEQKRNLIYIFLESMETTFSDIENGGGFEEDVIPELTRIAQENEDFSGNESILNGAYSLPYTTFTMGAMFAQSSGLPLKNNLENNDMVTQSHFFANTTCLGDILEDNGYTNVLMLGSNATFGGRRLYYQTHGNYEIYDYNYAKTNGWISSDYKVWWGFEDDKLLTYAQRELDTLSQSEEPFALTLLTVDTHFENGYVCSDCPDTFTDNQYANVMACSSSKISAFLDWCKTQSWYENTTIVICGDHPTMDSDFCNDVDGSYQRRAYVAYVNAVAQTESDTYRAYSTLDAFPTTLAAMGVTIEGNRLGLGVNLFSDEQTIIEEYGLGYVTEEINKKSTFMEELADIDFNEDLQQRQSWSLKEDHGKTVYNEE